MWRNWLAPRPALVVTRLQEVAHISVVSPHDAERLAALLAYATAASVLLQQYLDEHTARRTRQAGYDSPCRCAACRSADDLLNG